MRLEHGTAETETRPAFSICIPNYNYANYIGQTIASVLAQDEGDLEIVVSDNASTDDSVEVVRSFGDDRIRVHVNRMNVGFGGNLDRAAGIAGGRMMILLSSDDLMHAGALRTYRHVIDALGDDADATIITASCDVIDPEGAVTGAREPDPSLWYGATRIDHVDPGGGPVLRLPADELLRRCLRTMRNPFNCLATAYPRTLYEAVEGYGGGRSFGPDKWFHWKILARATQAIYIDRPLFSYRWHSSNQTAQQAAMGSLRFLVDEYLATLDVDETILSRAGLRREDVVDAFVAYDVVRHGVGTLADGNTAKGRRIVRFGASVYPRETRRDLRVWALRGLVALGPAGRALARAIRGRAGAADRRA